jgi:2OG-Fe(II) oxygenase superfamily
VQLSSYAGHEFVVKFLDPAVHKAGQEVTFIKGVKDEKAIINYSSDAGMYVTQITKDDELLDKVTSKTAICDSLLGDEFTKCFKQKFSEELIRADDELSKTKLYRDMMSFKLRNYTCDDTAMKTSPPDRSMTFLSDGAAYNTDILLDMPSAKIWTAKDFISEEECNILHEFGLPRLTTATVAGDDGKAQISKHRKAQQAAYRDPSDPLLPLRKKILAMTNLVTGYDLKIQGQEDFTIIQYNKDDEYNSHCDGSCDGSAYNPGGRVASALMYCQVADVGGGTTFTKAGVFVKPVKGMATFFSYRGSDGLMDVGYTEHSGCRVVEGEKWITTFWMRDGVTDERPWNMYDPFGIVTDYTVVEVTAIA